MYPSLSVSSLFFSQKIETCDSQEMLYYRELHKQYHTQSPLKSKEEMIKLHQDEQQS